MCTDTYIYIYMHVILYYIMIGNTTWYYIILYYTILYYSIHLFVHEHIMRRHTDVLRGDVLDRQAIYVYIYIYTLCMCIYIYIHNLSLYLSLSIYIYIYHRVICMHVCMYVCMYACMHACIHACMYACMYVCIYTHIDMCSQATLPTDFFSAPAEPATAARGSETA